MTRPARDPCGLGRASLTLPTPVPGRSGTCNHGPATASHPDHNALWGTIRRTFENLEQASPPGFIPRVQVTLDDGETFEPSVVSEIGPFAFFEADEGNHVTEDRRVIAVRPERIARVEIRFVRSDESFGFRMDAPAVVQPDE